MYKSYGSCKKNGNILKKYSISDVPRIILPAIGVSIYMVVTVRYCLFSIIISGGGIVKPGTKIMGYI